MKINVSEYVWLSDRNLCSVEHLAEVSGLSLEELSDLIEMGLILPVPADIDAQPKSFSLHYVITANLARRLRDDFELDRNGMVLAVRLMQRIDALQEELEAMRAKR
jgi:chaperone modulatory protein CbpM